MPRLPYAAETLTDAVQSLKSDAKWYEEGEPDGLGVTRAIRFDKKTSDWLTPLLDSLQDERIESLTRNDKNQLVVTFSPRPVADWRDPFPLEEAQIVSET